MEANGNSSQWSIADLEEMRTAIDVTIKTLRLLDGARGDDAPVAPTPAPSAPTPTSSSDRRTMRNEMVACLRHAGKPLTASQIHAKLLDRGHKMPDDVSIAKTSIRNVLERHRDVFIKTKKDNAAYFALQYGAKKGS